MEFEQDIDALYATYQSLLPMAKKDSKRLWQKFRLDWNYNSNRIEGNTLTRGETKALLEQGIKPRRMRKDILQMQSHDKAIDYLRELVDSNAPITEIDIRGLHKTALGENYWTEAITAENVITRREIAIGTYKKVPNIVLKSDGTTHEYASPQEVPARMDATVKRIRQYLKKRDTALHDFVAELHQDFIQTHPFDDGNGRVVRLLINYVCMKCDWPPVIIKSEKRPEYIASLESWNDGDEKPLRDLMKRELIWSLKKSIAAARGEDIEDPDDLNKEIDLFVQETSAKAFANEKREREFEKHFRSLYWRSLSLIAEASHKFDKVFDKVLFDPPLIKVLDKTLQVMRVDRENHPFHQVVVMHGFKPLKEQVNCTLILSGIKDDSGTRLSSRLKSNCSMTVENLEIGDVSEILYSETLEIRVSKDQKFCVSEEDIDKFSLKTSRLLLNKLALIST